MKISIGLVTQSNLLRTYFTQYRHKIVPQEIFSRDYFRNVGVTFSVRVLPPTGRIKVAELDGWLKRLAQDSDGVIIFVDDHHRNCFSQFDDAYFIVDIPTGHEGVTQNFVHKLVTITLRQFEALSKNFDEFRTHKMLLLPLDVFSANELRQLRLRLTTNKMSSGLGFDLQQLLSQIGQRERPKSGGRYRTRYLVDDRGFWYHYGKEVHKRVATGVPPHRINCWHNSRFRFGRRYDELRHFNVDNDSDPTKVTGTFQDCHGSQISVKSASHLGIFPNGHQ